MANTKTIQERGLHGLGGLLLTGKFKTSAAVRPNRLLVISTAGEVSEATSESVKVIGVSIDHTANDGQADVARGTSVVETETPVVAGQRLKAGTAGAVTTMIDSDIAGDTIHTTGAGEAFTNQPANDSVTIVSDSALDITQTITLIGTTTATDTVVVEANVVTGVVGVVTAKLNWGQIVAVKKSAATVGTITITETSGGLTITTLAPADLSAGVETITGGYAYNTNPTIVASGASTKQIGLQGTNAAGTVIYDSQALNGATEVIMNSSFLAVTEIYTGDLEAGRTVTLAQTDTVDSPDLYVGRALENQTVAGDTVFALIEP